MWIRQYIAILMYTDSARVIIRACKWDPGCIFLAKQGQYSHDFKVLSLELPGLVFLA